jgi:hypothetical protein
MTQLELFEEINKHERVVGPFFNLKCKCGFIDNKVSEKYEFEWHLSRALTEAGYGKVEA